MIHRSYVIVFKIHFKMNKWILNGSDEIKHDLRLKMWKTNQIIRLSPQNEIYEAIVCTIPVPCFWTQSLCDLCLRGQQYNCPAAHNNPLMHPYLGSCRKIKTTDNSLSHWNCILETLFFTFWCQKCRSNWEYCRFKEQTSVCGKTVQGLISSPLRDNTNAPRVSEKILKTLAVWQ